jgi:hypothetical protein
VVVVVLVIVSAMVSTVVGVEVSGVLECVICSEAVETALRLMAPGVVLPNLLGVRCPL